MCGGTPHLQETINTMKMKYEVHKIENAQGTGKSRVFVKLRNEKAMPTEQLLREIEASCTLKASDVKAVMTEISEIAIRELSQGKRFHLPEMGYLSLAVANTPPAKKANGKITGKDIRVRNIHFRPEKKLLTEIGRNVSFTKSDYSTLSAKYEEEVLWGKVAGYLAPHRYITKQTMLSEFGLSEYKARRWLNLFVNNGKLTKDSSHRPFLYFH